MTSSVSLNLSANVGRFRIQLNGFFRRQNREGSKRGHGTRATVFFVVCVTKRTSTSSLLRTRLTTKPRRSCFVASAAALDADWPGYPRVGMGGLFAHYLGVRVKR